MSLKDAETLQPCEAEQIFAALSRKQYLRPHRLLADVLADLPLCPIALAQALRWLEVDATRSIGRMRASELSQLARCIHRLWLNGESAANLIAEKT